MGMIWLQPPLMTRHSRNAPQDSRWRAVPFVCLSGILTYFCWTPVRCGPQKKAGWNLTSQQLAICGWWLHSTTWDSSWVWWLRMVSCDLHAASICPQPFSLISSVAAVAEPLFGAQPLAPGWPDFLFPHHHIEKQDPSSSKGLEAGSGHVPYCPPSLC